MNDLNGDFSMRVCLSRIFQSQGLQLLDLQSNMVQYGTKYSSLKITQNLQVQAKWKGQVRRQNNQYVLSVAGKGIYGSKGLFGVDRGKDLPVLEMQSNEELWQCTNCAEAIFIAYCATQCLELNNSTNNNNDNNTSQEAAFWLQIPVPNTAGSLQDSKI